MADGYQVSLSRLTGDLDGMLPAWQAFYERAGGGRISRSPEWLMERYRDGEGAVRGRDDLLVFFGKYGDEIVGATPFVVARWPIPCRLGELTLARLPLRRACLPLSDPNLPDDDGARDALFGALAAESERFDVAYLEDLEVDGPFWRYLSGSEVVRRHFRIYSPNEPSKHGLIRMPETFEEYLRKFSSKSRATLRRKKRKLEKRHRVEIDRIDEPHQVDAFVDAAEVVSRASYQYALLGLGMQDPAREKRTLGFLARHGWLRSYLLRTDGAACAYLIGIQDGHAFWYWDVAHDPEWNRQSVGTVLLYSVLEDLFAHRRPPLVDFSTGEGEHKTFFANEWYRGADLYLVPRRFYPRTALRLHMATDRLTRSVSAVLDRFHLKSRIKKAIRWASVRGDRSKP